MQVKTKLVLIGALMNAIAIVMGKEGVAIAKTSNILSLVSPNNRPAVGQLGISALLGEAALLEDFAAFMKKAMEEFENLKQAIKSTKEQLRKEIAAQGESLTNKIETQGKTLTEKIVSVEKGLEAKISAQGTSLTNKIETQGTSLTNKISSVETALERKIAEQAQSLSSVKSSLSSEISNVKSSLKSEISNVKSSLKSEITSVTSAMRTCQVGVAAHNAIGGYDVIGEKSRTVIKKEVHQTFGRSFSSTPTVVIGLKQIRQTAPTGGAKGVTDDSYGWDLYAEKVTRSGFDAVLVADDRKINEMAGAWVACA